MRSHFLNKNQSAKKCIGVKGQGSRQPPHARQVRSTPKVFGEVIRGECCRLRERIDITRANQKPVLHIAQTNHLAVFDIANKLYTLNPSGPTRVFTDHFTDHFIFIFFV